MNRIAILLAITCLASAAESSRGPVSDNPPVAPLPAYVRQASAPYSLYFDLRGALIVDSAPDPAEWSGAAATIEAAATASGQSQPTVSKAAADAVGGSGQSGALAAAGAMPPITRLSLGFTGTTIVEYEGNAGPRTITLSITRSAGWAGAATVRYDTSDQSATTADGDYVGVINGLVSWAPGDPDTKTISITVNGDTNEETDQSFLVTLSSPTGDTLGANKIVMIALRNDDGPSAALAESSAAAIQPNGTGDSGACGAGAITGLLLGFGGLGLVRRRQR